MKTFIAAIPFFDSNISVEAYRLNFRSGEKLLGMMDSTMKVSDAVLTPGLDLVKTLGVEPIAGDRPLFIDINEYHLLMREVPLTLSSSANMLVCVLPNNILPDDAVLSRCKELKELGFGLAVDGFLEGHTNNRLFEMVDTIIVDITDLKTDKRFINAMANLSRLKKVVLTNIPDMETFEQLNSLTNTLYSGDFYNQPITKGVSKISPIKINALTLLRRINEEDFDLSDIADTIERDPSLSISLLRFINTAMPRKIKSIRNAVAILGQKEVKRWATAAVSIQLAADRPNEISKLSLMRARFAENLAGSFEMGIHSSSLFLMGLFSLLDVIIEKPMKVAVKEVALDESVREALVDKAGELYKVLEFIYAYERADWDDVAIIMVRNNLDLDEINKAFVESLVWYKSLLDAIGEEES